MIEELTYFETFVVIDNGNGLNTENYTSFLEAYSQLKRPQRNDFATEETDPITQVYDYVTDIKEGKVKKTNGRGFGNIQKVVFYIADITPTLRKSAARAGLVLT